MGRTEEKTFVQKLKKMDERAWEVFCKEYASLLLRFVQIKFSCSRERAEEIVQMTFVRCVKSIRNFEPSRGRLFDWLKTISANEAHTLLRQEQKTRPLATLVSDNASVPEGILEKIDRVSLPDNIAAQREIKQLVHETVIELYTQYRKVLILKYVKNRKVAEIAETLGQSMKAVESLLSRSRDAFRKTLIKKIKEKRIERSELYK